MLIVPTLNERDDRQIITIGNQPDIVKLCPECKASNNIKNAEIRIEPYMRIILDRLKEFNEIYIKTFPYPAKLGKIQEIFERLHYYGVCEIKPRKRVFEQHKVNPDKKIEIMIITWELHPKLQVYREIEILRKMKSE